MFLFNTSNNAKNCITNACFRFVPSLSREIHSEDCFGGDDDARKLALNTGIPKTVDDLVLEIIFLG